MFVKRYRKFILAAIAGLVVLLTALADDNVTTAEWWQIAAAVLGPLGVVLVPNEPKRPTPTQPLRTPDKFV
jgi:hypothetical protein